MAKEGSCSVKRKTHSPHKQSNEKAAKKDCSVKSKVTLKEMKKVDLINHCDLLQMAHDKLQQENEILRKQLNECKDELKLIQSKDNSNERNVYYCGECDYVADCIHDFTDHSHDEFEFTCYYCEGTFETKLLVMNHTKIYHFEQVQHCINFLQDSCSFGDDCWFRHDDSFKSSSESFKCNFCDSTFKLKWQLMTHKKNEHMQMVARCSKEQNGCTFGSKKCWFLHNDKIEMEYNNVKMNNANGSSTTRNGEKNMNAHISTHHNEANSSKKHTY